MIPRQRRFDLEQELAAWMRAHPEYIQNKVEAFTLFTHKPSLRRKLPVEPPAHCSRCGCSMEEFSFRFYLLPGWKIEPDGKDEKGQFATVVPIDRICRSCNLAIGDEIAAMHHRDKLPPVRAKRG